MNTDPNLQGFKTSHVAITVEEHARFLSLATETERVIEQKFKHRGWTTGKKQWEQKLLALAKVALGKPARPIVDQFGEPK